MARAKYSVQVCGYADEQTDKSIVFIRADSISDVHGIDDKWDVGSTLYDISTGKTYMLNSSAVWVETN